MCSANVFWEDPVGKFIDYFRLSRPFVDKIYVISHNSRGYDAQFLLRRFLELKWKPDLVMDGTKILSMTLGHLKFLDSLNFLPMSLKSMPNHLISHARRGTTPTSSTRPRIWIMWALILNPSSTGRTTCQVMSEPNFWNGMEGKRQNFP